MLRTRKWVALTCLALLALAGFAALSVWQWERAQRDMIVSQPIVPIDQIVPGSGSVTPDNYGKRVEATGTYDRTHQVLVRRDASTYVVVTPLIRPSALAIAVARGTVASPNDPAIDTVPAGRVTVTGTIQPFDGDPGGASSLPAGQVRQLTAAAVGVTPILGAWVAQTPAESGLAETTVAYGPSAGTGLRAQNVTYAIQWILFAGCVVYFWWRILRDDVNEEIRRKGEVNSSVAERIVADDSSATATASNKVTQSKPDPTRKKVY